MKSLLKSENGSSLLEFALVLPVLCVLLIGLIDLGRAGYYGILASGAARAGAQYGAQTLGTAGDTAGMQNAVTTDAPGVTWTTTATPLCSVNGGPLISCGLGGNLQNTVYYVKVHVTATFTSLIQYPGIPHQVPVGGDSVMRVTTQ
jgi:Flp pilus assembly protein TadG